MQLRFHEIAESYHRILNPFIGDQLELLGDICRIQPGMKQLDLACGKGEMLGIWAQRYGISGIGVDISAVFLEDGTDMKQPNGWLWTISYVPILMISMLPHLLNG
jgi:ubiquinone/menaquinone biosynthesis C-methylase UbiE